MKLEELSKIDRGMTAIMCKDREQMLQVVAILKSGGYDEAPTYSSDEEDEEALAHQYGYGIL